MKLKWLSINIRIATVTQGKGKGVRQIFKSTVDLLQNSFCSISVFVRSKSSTGELSFKAQFEVLSKANGPACNTLRNLLLFLFPLLQLSVYCKRT